MNEGEPGLKKILKIKISRRGLLKAGAGGALGGALTVLGTKIIDSLTSVPEGQEYIEGEVSISPDVSLRSSPYMIDPSVDPNARPNIVFGPGEHEKITLRDPRLVRGGGVNRIPASKSDEYKNFLWAEVPYKDENNKERVAYVQYYELTFEGKGLHPIKPIPTPTR